jgi:hypothetical protein
LPLSGLMSTCGLKCNATLAGPCILTGMCLGPQAAAACSLLRTGACIKICE